MPEARNQVSRLGTAGNSPGGFWIRRGPSVAAVRGRRGILRGITDNKENVTSPWAVGRIRRTTKSPLPVWYPRTPLRDITAIVNALERTRMRRRAVRRRHLQNQESTSSPQSELCPVPQTHDANHTPPDLCLVSAASPSLASTSSSPLSSMGRWQEMSSPNSVFLSKQTSIAGAAAASDSQSESLLSTEYEKKLDSSIDEIEKVVRKNLKKTPQAPPKKATCSLMSMR